MRVFIAIVQNQQKVLLITHLKSLEMVREKTVGVTSVGPHLMITDNSVPKTPGAPVNIC